ncbi:LAME_0E08020g1_1 [Lachancea meyersii CBS 8951]|uniref:2-(3-amino-3-carboxypropyl)histidine synthase subunit 2 n=1 Tax=Lachancea meyersii CBS 8951 TaxID=1266667 RepID=A0A1G4JJ33_9SACH|nr:LAME_0E08020g1_1 [Lachancea meyersii CBS 8951]
MSGETVVAPALSTTQGDETFNLGRFSDVEKDRSGYLGCNPDSRSELLKLISEHYLVEEIVRFLNERREFSKITLQFPDSLVQDSAIVAQLLQERILSNPSGQVDSKDQNPTCENGSGAECCQKSADQVQSDERSVWILADTAYSACCVDEVASEHVNGDLVIHFGDACLNAVQKLPVLYCFGRPFLDLDNTIAQFQNTYQSTDEKVILMANAPYTCYLRVLYDKLQTLGYQNVIYSDLNEDFAGPTASFVGRQSNDQVHTVFTLYNRILLSEEGSLTLDAEDLQNDYNLFHITLPADPRLLFLTTKFKSLSIYDPSDKSVSQGPFPSMMRRYKYMHVARTAGTIGVLVNTLSLRNTNETLRRLAELIKDNGKKHYMFVVGKPNVAKLANFEPVDVWCILGCGQSGIIVDQYNEFLKPIVTPYELTMALNPEVTWTGQWVVDFKQILEDLDDDADETNTENNSQESSENPDSDAPEFNAVTGQYVSTSRPLRNLARVEISDPCQDNKQSSNQLVEKCSGALTIGNTFSTSAAHLQSRQWSGLGSDFTSENFEEEGASLEQGISGIASQYAFDKQNKASS